MEKSGTYKKIQRLVDPSKWPPELNDAVESGDYVFRRLASDWAILISLKPDEYIDQGIRNKMPGRMAIRLTDGQTFRCPSGVRISDWEAELAGTLDEKREKERQLQRESDREIDEFLKGEAPVKNWESIGGPIPGIPKSQDDEGSKK